MSDLELLAMSVDTIVVAPPDQQQRRLASFTVCEVMTRDGSMTEQIRQVLGALGLDPRAQGAGEPPGARNRPRSP